jgi:hypothetical protein
MNTLHASIRGENGRPLKAIIPPRTTKEVWVQETQTTPTTLFSPKELAKRSVFVVNRRYEHPVLVVMLYNGGMETQWIEDGDVVAEY